MVMILKQLIFGIMKKILLSFVWQLAVLVTVFSAFGSLSSANASDVLKLGDVDGNGSVNVVDITVLVNYLRTPSTVKINTTTADANRDGKVNAADEAAIANIILSGTPDQSANSVIFFTEATVEKAFGNAISNPVVLAGSTGAITYSASPASVVTVNAKTGDVTYVGVGQATITATLAASGKFKGATAQYTLKVTKNTSTDPDDVMMTEPEANTADDEGNNQSYTGEEIPLITEGESGAGTVRYKVTTTNEKPSKDDDGWTTEVPSESDAGTYYVWYYTDGTDNSVESEVCSTPIEVTIDKAPSNSDPADVMTKVPEAKTADSGSGGGNSGDSSDDNQTFTGEPLPLITEGESNVGTIHYKVTETNEMPSKDDGGWTTEVPTATDAGTYYVWYYADGNDNCDETPVSSTPIEVTIDKTPSTTDPAETMTTMPAAKKTDGGDNPTYTGGAQPLITEGETNGGTIHYKVTTNDTPPSKTEDGWTTEVPTATDPGTYYVWYYTDGNDNCEETPVSGTPITATIAKTAATTDPATTMTTMPAAKKTEGGANPTYTGSAQPLITAGESKAGTVKYKATTTNTQPSKSDAGWSTSVPTATDAGTYYVWYYAEGNDKYEETAVSGTPITATIAKTAATTDPATTMTTMPAAKKTEGGANPTYTGSAQPLITAGESKAGTLKYKATTTNTPPSKSDAGWTTTVPTATDAGTYYVWYYAEGNGNYSETAVSSTPITVIIDQAISPSTTINPFENGGGGSGTLNF